MHDDDDDDDDEGEGIQGNTTGERGAATCRCRLSVCLSHLMVRNNRIVRGLTVVT